MAVNDLVCEDINVGSLDLLMPSVMKKTWQQVDTRGRGSNDAGNDEDGRQQFRKWNKKTNLLYFDVRWESIDYHGHGYVVEGNNNLSIASKPVNSPPPKKEEVT